MPDPRFTWKLRYGSQFAGVIHWPTGADCGAAGRGLDEAKLLKRIADERDGAARRGHYLPRQAALVGPAACMDRASLTTETD